MAILTEEPLLVSVVIVSHNGRKYLGDLLTSVLDQDLPKEQYEVVVVDNNSLDGSADLVEQLFPSVRVIRLDRNYGPGVAVDRASPQLRGRYLAYLNQDVVVNHRWLSELVRVITDHPRVGIVESNMILPEWPEFNNRDGEKAVERAYVCDITSLGVYDFRAVPVTADSPPIPVLCLCGAGFLLNPQVEEAVGYLVEPKFLSHAEDMDLGLRVNAAGYQVLLAPQSVVYHDTEWHFHWNMRNLRRAFYVTRNTILTFYKISYTPEFLRLLPRLFVGKLIKAGQHCSSPLPRIAYALLATPIALVGSIGALLAIPNFRERRRVTLEHRVTAPGWLVDCLLGADWKPDRTVWRGAVMPKTVPSGTRGSERQV